MLYIISTPIGNLEDISIRAIRTIFSLDILLAEDTRRAGQLLHTLTERFPMLIPSHAKEPKLVSYYDQVEFQKLPEIIEWLKNGKSLGLISDNGTPLISDPGFRLVHECHKRNLPMTVIPGPSAVIAALSVSGLPTDNFQFIGFLPDKESARLKILNNQMTQKNHTTYIAYVSPHRLKESLQTFQTVIGTEQNIVIARELTKIHESIWKGNVMQALEQFQDPKGEFVLLWTIENE